MLLSDSVGGVIRTLTRRVAPGHHLKRAVDEDPGVGALLRFINGSHIAAAEVRVHSHAVAHSTAQQLIDWPVQRLPRMSQQACSIPEMADSPMTPMRQNDWRYIF